jgi:hypothetical protein
MNVTSRRQSRKFSEHEPAMHRVFDGRRCCGHVLVRGKYGFESLDENDRSLGFFATRDEAATVLLARCST